MTEVCAEKPECRHDSSNRVRSSNSNAAACRKVNTLCWNTRAAASPATNGTGTQAPAGFYKPFVTVPVDRSLMNVDFFLPTEELIDKLVKEAKAAGMVGLNGYRDIDSIRMSMYSTVTVDNITTLVSYMEEFVKKNG